MPDLLIRIKTKSDGSAALDDNQLFDIRRHRDDLFATWRAVPAGEVLELPYSRAPVAVA
jgi:hypothetical protein